MKKVLPEFAAIDVTSCEDVMIAVDAWVEQNKDHSDVLHANEGFDVMTYLHGSAKQCFDFISKYADQEDEEKITMSIELQCCGDCKLNIKVVHKFVS
jgi:hypothetical protein